MLNLFTVHLRCGDTARVHELDPDLQVHIESNLFAAKPLESLFIYMGIDSEGWPHLWRFDGRWREDGSDSPFDIVVLSAATSGNNSEPPCTC